MPLIGRLFAPLVSPLVTLAPSGDWRDGGQPPSARLPLTDRRSESVQEPIHGLANRVR